MKKIMYFAAIVIIAMIGQSCSVKTNALLYNEPSISPDEIEMRTVAILPNRLPLTLQDPEKWRQINYNFIKQNFESRGYRVIDYKTSVEEFTTSGLPLEDTKSSRDKYAELAEKIGADVLVFPYYGFTFNSNALRNKYIGFGTFQCYAKGQNDFITRIDFDGSKVIHTWPGMLPFAGIVYNIVVSAIPANSHYESIFESTINESINSFTERYKGNVKKSTNKSDENLKNSTQSNPYDKYSKQELEQMKTKAVQDKDFKKAAEIKAELDKRN